jgi:hypothetical protein
VSSHTETGRNSFLLLTCFVVWNIEVNFFRFKTSIQSSN